MAEVAAEAATRGRLRDVRLQLPAHPRPGPGPADGRDGRLGTIRHVRAQYLQDWLSRRERAADLADGQGQVRLRRPGRHRRAQHRRRPVRHRPAASPAFRRSWRPSPRSVPLAGTSSGSAGTATRRRASSAAPVTVDDARSSAPAFDGGPASACSRPPGSPLGRKNAMRLEVNGSHGLPRLRLRGHELPAFLRRRSDADRDPRGFRRIMVTEARPPLHRQLVADRPRPRLRTRLHPPGGGPLTAIGAGTQPTPSFADALQVQRVLAAVEDSAGNGIPAGLQSDCTTRTITTDCNKERLGGARRLGRPPARRGHRPVHPVPAKPRATTSGSRSRPRSTPMPTTWPAST